MIVSGVAFTETAEKIARLQKGDALSVVGSLKPSEWTDKATGVTKHGLSITANASLRDVVNAKIPLIMPTY